MNVSAHCLERFQIHHPDATKIEVVEYYAGSVGVATPLALTLLGRLPNKATNTRFFLSPDRNGMFALDGHTLVTYLRFGPKQVEFCRRHWPIADVPKSVSQALPVKKLLRHPEIDLVTRHVKVTDSLREKMGSRAESLRAIHRSRKLQSHQNPNTWDTTHVLHDPETDTTIKIGVPWKGGCPIADLKE